MFHSSIARCILYNISSDNLKNLRKLNAASCLLMIAYIYTVFLKNLITPTSSSILYLLILPIIVYILDGWQPLFQLDKSTEVFAWWHKSGVTRFLLYSLSLLWLRQGHKLKHWRRPFHIECDATLHTLFRAEDGELAMRVFTLVAMLARYVADAARGR